MSRFIEVPARMLPPDTLNALLEAFVTRQGYDTTDTTGEGMHGWVVELKKQLERNELIIAHDLELDDRSDDPGSVAFVWARYRRRRGRGRYLIVISYFVSHGSG